LVPGLGDLPVEESWAGLRPTTPDKGPILGRTKWDNLFIAGGYWRNGVLLAPKTGQLIGDLVLNDGGVLDDEDDEALLEAFKWDRFTVPGGGKKLAADARYAASMHPVHKRSSGVGVAAAVGTELGFYSGAADAAQERQQDRESLFQDFGVSGSEEDAFEKAARLGKTDATAFSYKSSIVNPKKPKEDASFQDTEPESSSTLPFDGTPDALTVGIASRENVQETEGDDLGSVYESIRENKAKATAGVEMSQVETEDRPDPGFRIYHVDSVTRKETLIPPYSSPLNREKETSPEDTTASETSSEKETVERDVQGENIDVPEPASTSTYDEKTFDGYQTIQDANSRASREEELKLMKQARMANRVKVSQIDESLIGVLPMDESDP